MKNYLALLLILTILLLAGCRPVDPVITDPSDPDLSATTPTATKPAEPEQTDPRPTKTIPTEPTVPLDPNGFPIDLNKDDEVLGKLQSLFACNHPKRNYFNTALCSQYEDTRYVNLAALFVAGIEDVKYTPTEDEIAQLVNQFGWDPEFDIYRLPTEGMDEILTQVFGISLSDMDKSAFESLFYLESSNTYFNTYNLTLCAHEFKAIGYYLLENGNVELYYEATYPAYKGIVTLKPVEDGYHILSNRWFE